MESITISQIEYVELLRYKDIVLSLESMIHEPAFKKEFVRRVMAAEERIAAGKKVRFETVDEMEKYLDKMDE